MAAITGVTLNKKFTYRDNPLEQFSNTYWFQGNPPTTPGDWRTLSDALITLERAVYPASVTVVSAYGYATDNPDDVSVWGFDYEAVGAAVAGSFTPAAGSHPFAGDQASVCWWETDRRTSKGKPIYLRKYFHEGYVLNTGPQDELEPTYLTALRSFVANVRDFHGGIRGQLHGVTILADGASQWVTTRTLKRRGKRPLTP